MKSNSFLDEYSKRWEERIPPRKFKIYIHDAGFYYEPLKLFLVSELLYCKESLSKLKKTGSIEFDAYIACMSEHEQKIEAEFMQILNAKTFGEFYLKRYLIENANKYDITFLKDLDKFFYGKRGDIAGIYKNNDVVIEVEKSDRDFISHKHKTSDEKKGRTKKNGIDIVFTLPPKTLNLPVETIYADEKDFGLWYQKEIKKKRVRDKLLLILVELVRRSLIKVSFLELIESSSLEEIRHYRISTHDIYIKIGDYLIYGKIFRQITDNSSFNMFYQSIITKLENEINEQ